MTATLVIGTFSDTDFAALRDGFQPVFVFTLAGIELRPGKRPVEFLGSV